MPERARRKPREGSFTHPRLQSFTVAADATSGPANKVAQLSPSSLQLCFSSCPAPTRASARGRQTFPPPPRSPAGCSSPALAGTPTGGGREKSSAVFPHGGRFSPRQQKSPGPPSPRESPGTKNNSSEPPSGAGGSEPLQPHTAASRLAGTWGRGGTPRPSQAGGPGSGASPNPLPTRSRGRGGRRVTLTGPGHGSRRRRVVLRGGAEAAAGLSQRRKPGRSSPQETPMPGLPTRAGPAHPTPPRRHPSRPPLPSPPLRSQATPPSAERRDGAAGWWGSSLEGGAVSPAVSLGEGRPGSPDPAAGAGALLRAVTDPPAAPSRRGATAEVSPTTLPRCSPPTITAVF